MTWLTRVATSILPQSLEKQDVGRALQEWFYTGETYDLEEPCEDCELCGHQDIRYQFTIRNRNTNSELLIGSECITRFEIPAVVNGLTLTVDETRTVVNRDRQKLVTDARKKRMTRALLELGRNDPNFNVLSFLDYVHDRGAFTPNQLSLLIWKLNTARVPYSPSDFKVIIKRSREQEQLLALPNFKLQQIWSCLSPSQRDFYTNNKDA